MGKIYEKPQISNTYFGFSSISLYQIGHYVFPTTTPGLETATAKIMEEVPITVFLRTSKSQNQNRPRAGHPLGVPRTGIQC